MRRVINLSALNIKFDDTDLHDPANYKRLFELINDNKIIEQYKRVTLGTIKIIKHSDVLKENYLRGEFMRCTDINDACAWFDTEKYDVIVDEDGNPIPQVSKNIKPNSEFGSFIFYPDGHRFLFDSKMKPSNSLISASSVKKLLDAVFSNELVLSEFGNITVEIETNIDTVQTILNMPHKKMLHIDFTLPNPDHLEDISARIVERAKYMNAQEYKEEYKSGDSNDLILDDEAKAKIGIASSNGFATLKYIGSDGKMDTISTKDYPLEEKIVYDDNKTNYMSVFAHQTHRILKQLIKRG